MDRSCNKCVYHIGGACSKYKCEMTTLEEYKNKVIDAFVAEAMKQFTDYDLKHGYPTVADCKIILRDITERMKEE